MAEGEEKTGNSEAGTGERPAFRGLSLHQDRELGFSFFRPIDWHRYDWTDGRQGVLFGPQPDDSETLFAVAVRELGTLIEEDDLADLHIGFVAGIGRLDESEIESQDQWKVGPLACFEARYTFLDEETRRKRWVRVFYQDSRQITVTAQGASVEVFDYWMPMLYESMMTFKVLARAGRKTMTSLGGEQSEAEAGDGGQEE